MLYKYLTEEKAGTNDRVQSEVSGTCFEGLFEGFPQNHCGAVLIAVLLRCPVTVIYDEATLSCQCDERPLYRWRHWGSGWGVSHSWAISELGFTSHLV